MNKQKNVYFLKRCNEHALHKKSDEYIFNFFLMFTNVSISVAEEEKKPFIQNFLL